jgi:hypothetical protein
MKILLFDGKLLSSEIEFSLYSKNIFHGIVGISKFKQGSGDSRAANQILNTKLPEISIC